MPPSALIFGYGYLGQPVAKLWSDDGRNAYAVTRSVERAAKIQSTELSAINADVTDPSTLGDLPTVDTVLFAVGYDRNSAKSIEEVYVDGVRNVLAALPDDIGRFIYISTTGVYGDAGGEWIDETTPTDPARAGGKASLAAEKLICASRFADRTVILRLAGIYGPERLPYLEQLKAGKAIEAPQSGYLNLIHVYDAARIVQILSAPAHNLAGPVIYCVSDGHPVVRGDYYREVARRLGAPEPSFVDPPAGSARAARAAADKRVSNSKLMVDLGIDLLYPSYREGLRGIIGADSSG